MRQFLAVALALCLACAAFGIERTDIQTDIAKPDPPLELETVAGTTPLFRMYVREDGYPYASLTGWTGVLFYATNSSPAAGMYCTNTARGSDYFDWRLTEGQTSMTGMYFAQIMLYSGGGSVEEARRGHLEILAGGVTGPFAPLNYNFTDAYSIAEMDAIFVGFSNNLTALTGAAYPTSLAARVKIADTSFWYQAFVWGNHAGLYASTNTASNLLSRLAAIEGMTNGWGSSTGAPTLGQFSASNSSVWASIIAGAATGASNVADIAVLTTGKVSQGEWQASNSVFGIGLTNRPTVAQWLASNGVFGTSASNDADRISTLETGRVTLGQWQGSNAVFGVRISNALDRVGITETGHVARGEWQASNGVYGAGITGALGRISMTETSSPTLGQWQSSNATLAAVTALRVTVNDWMLTNGYFSGRDTSTVGRLALLENFSNALQQGFISLAQAPTGVFASVYAANTNTLGGNLVSNSTFDIDSTFWTLTNCTRTVGGEIRFDNGTSGDMHHDALTAEANQLYVLRFKVRFGGLDGQAYVSANFGGKTLTVMGGGTQQVAVIVAAPSTAGLWFDVFADNNDTFLDNVYLYKITDGNLWAASNVFAKALWIGENNITNLMHTDATNWTAGQIAPVIASNVTQGAVLTNLLDRQAALESQTNTWGGVSNSPSIAAWQASNAVMGAVITGTATRVSVTETSFPTLGQWQGSNSVFGSGLSNRPTLGQLWSSNTLLAVAGSNAQDRAGIVETGKPSIAQWQGSNSALGASLTGAVGRIAVVETGTVTLGQWQTSNALGGAAINSLTGRVSVLETNRPTLTQWQASNVTAGALLALTTGRVSVLETNRPTLTQWQGSNALLDVAITAGASTNVTQGTRINSNEASIAILSTGMTSLGIFYPSNTLAFAAAGRADSGALAASGRVTTAEGYTNEAHTAYGWGNHALAGYTGANTNTFVKLYVADQGNLGGNITTNPTFISTNGGWKVGGAMWWVTGGSGNKLSVPFGGEGTAQPTNLLPLASGHVYQVTFDIETSDSEETITLTMGSGTIVWAAGATRTCTGIVCMVTSNEPVLTISAVADSVYLDNWYIKEVLGGDVNLGGILRARDVEINGSNMAAIVSAAVGGVATSGLIGAEQAYAMTNAVSTSLAALAARTSTWDTASVDATSATGNVAVLQARRFTNGTTFAWEVPTNTSTWRTRMTHSGAYSRVDARTDVGTASGVDVLYYAIWSNPTPTAVMWTGLVVGVGGTSFVHQYPFAANSGLAVRYTNSEAAITGLEVNVEGWNP